MDQTHLNSWFQQNPLPQLGAKYIQRVFSSPPARRPQNRYGTNVTGSYPSRKMGFTINFESHRCELPAIYQHEHDDEVIAYFDQPEPIKLIYPDANGKNTGFFHTPDFLIIRENGAVLQEWKPESALKKLAERMPNRYVPTEDGGWNCPPGEEAAKELGLTYEVHSTSELNPCYQRNVVYLENYCQGEPEQVPESIIERVKSLVHQTPGISLSKLAEAAETASADHLNLMILSGDIFVDLASEALVNREFVRVFESRDVAAAYLAIQTEVVPDDFQVVRPVIMEPEQKVLWNGQPLEIKVIGNDTILFEDAQGRTVTLSKRAVESCLLKGELTAPRKDPAAAQKAKTDALSKLLAASPQQLALAYRRWRIISPYLDQPIPDDGEEIKTSSDSARSRRRWKSSYNQAKERFGIGYLGLLAAENPGNRRAKLSEATKATVEEHIAKEYENIRNQRKSSVYAILVKYCEENGIKCPSRKTFSRMISMRPQHAQAVSRGGKRYAYTKEFHWTLEPHTPRHGDRVFEIGHIDHTVLDIELICPKTGKNLGRPWLTLMIDAYSRRILAVYLSFDGPTYRSCLMVLRICVQRHARLPQILVVDGGKEFTSTYFDTTLAMFKCAKKLRPPAKPRFGSVCERLFQTTNTEFIHNLLGNTQLMKNPRTVTKSVNPKNTAVWTFDELHDQLCHFAYEVYDTNTHPALHQTPRDAAALSLQRDGERGHIRIAYDEILKITTLPSTRNGTAVIRPTGVRIGYINYTCIDFRDPKFQGKTVRVRYDPFDIGTAWAYLDGQWVKCISEYHHIFNGRTEQELKTATEELRMQNRLHHTKGVKINAAKIGEFLMKCHGVEDKLNDLKAALGPGNRPGATPPPTEPVGAAPAVVPIGEQSGQGDDAHFQNASIENPTPNTQPNSIQPLRKLEGIQL